MGEMNKYISISDLVLIGGVSKTLAPRAQWNLYC